jgi:hypothetical protein
LFVVTPASSEMNAAPAGRLIHHSSRQMSESGQKFARPLLEAAFPTRSHYHTGDDLTARRGLEPLNEPLKKRYRNFLTTRFSARYNNLEFNY